MTKSWFELTYSTAVLISRGRRRGSGLDSSTDNDTLLGSPASDACGVSSRLPWRPVRVCSEAAEADVQSTVTFWGEKCLGGSGLDTWLSVSPGLHSGEETFKQSSYLLLIKT